jgi:hypothetical protein
LAPPLPATATVVAAPPAPDDPPEAGVVDEQAPPPSANAAASTERSGTGERPFARFMHPRWQAPPKRGHDFERKLNFLRLAAHNWRDMNPPTPGAWGTVVTMLAALIGCGESRGNILTIPDGGAPDGGAWQLGPRTTWQVQLTGKLDTTIDARLYIVDFEDVGAATIAELHAAGRAVACYLSAGSWESWRSDATSFPVATIGNPMANYPQEYWLDIRDGTVQGLMLARVNRARSNGCDAIELSNLSNTGQDTGFAALASTDYVTYGQAMARAVSARGMSVGLDGAEDLLGELLPVFDWGAAVDCFATDGCQAWSPMLAANRPVLLVEFGDAATAQEICASATQAGYDALIKNRAFDAFRIPCIQ